MNESQAKDRISRNLRKLRGNKSLAEIARRARTYPTAIKEIEETSRMPSVWMLIRLASALNVDLNEFIRPIRRNHESVSSNDA